MSDTVGRARHSIHKFDREISDNKPLGFDRNRNKEYVHRNIREKKSERQKDAVDRTRGSYHRSIDEGVEHRAVGVGVVIAPLQYAIALLHHLLNHIPGQQSFEIMDIYRKNSHLHQCCKYAAGHIIEEETRRSHCHLYRFAEDEQREHVEEQVHEIAVQEHVGEQLEWLERRRRKIIQRQILGQHLIGGRDNRHKEPHQHIDNQEILDYRRN